MSSSRFLGIYGVRTLGGDWIRQVGAEVLGETSGLSLDFRALSVLESVLLVGTRGRNTTGAPRFVY
jgi:hypothetical protein